MQSAASSLRLRPDPQELLPRELLRSDLGSWIRLQPFWSVAVFVYVRDGLALARTPIPSGLYRLLYFVRGMGTSPSLETAEGGRLQFITQGIQEQVQEFTTDSSLMRTLNRVCDVLCFMILCLLSIVGRRFTFKQENCAGARCQKLNRCPKVSV